MWLELRRLCFSSCTSILGVRGGCLKHLMSGYLMGVHLIGKHLISMHLMGRY